jgi:hypothetical protein
MSDSLAGVPEISSTTYDRLAVGDRFGPFEESFAQRTSDALRGPVGTSLAGAHAPPGMLPLVTLRALRRALNGIVPGGVLTRQRFVIHADLPAAADVGIEVRVSDQAQRPSGLYTTFTFALRHGGSLAAVVEWTILAP